MQTNDTLLHDINDALTTFPKKNHREAALNLFSALGYQSQRTSPELTSPHAFLELLKKQNEHFHLDPIKSRFNEWISADILFQITDEEIDLQQSLPAPLTLEPQLFDSYLFFALQLSAENYSRSFLSFVTRSINRAFPMPLLILFSYGKYISFGIINRRQHQREPDLHVLDKVTLIHNINTEAPHRAHLSLLQSFALPTLQAQRLQPLRSFPELHEALEKVFDVELLNQRFYQDISSWYFWARRHVRFPDDIEKDNDIRHATSVIRLLTRLIFCWFLKEKKLIPEDLFQSNALASVLHHLNDENSSSYYQAILQNLFFATLNQPMNTPKQQHRVFADDQGFPKNKQHYGVKNLYRYRTLFQKPDQALALFQEIPFLNGGLFNCLDIEDEKNNHVRYADGFSRNPKKQAHVPNFLFFSPETEIDLSKELGEKKRRPVKVRGLLDILHSYKFTVTENTPIEEEIALDPELLGKIFENLLASFNPETGETARKQTGSFYTPRSLVDYMVDVSLKAYLLQKLALAFPKIPKETQQQKLDTLFAYTDQVQSFDEKESDLLIQAIDEVKILDPACGSGAFPMGCLHKLVFLLNRLDPKNQRWKQRQLDGVTSQPLRKEIERIFDEHQNDDYGRKLYLIEHCLYGVDIQPIAIQITKLRFFISLLCEQKNTNPSQENRGIQPLPNLETKFVAANTLLTLPKKAKQESLFGDLRIAEVQRKIEEKRHLYFIASSRKEKLKLQKEDQTLREELLKLVQTGDLFTQTDDARLVADWNPYDPYASAAFFEPAWMFGRSVEKGFDIVIGNPPYVQIQKLNKAQKDTLVAQGFVTYGATADLYCLFYERAAQLLLEDGQLCYITSNKWMRAAYGEKLRGYLAALHTQIVIDFGMAQNFSAATTYTNILLATKQPPASPPLACYAKDARAAMDDPATYLATHAAPLPAVNKDPWVVLSAERQRIKSLAESQGIPLKEWKGLQINYGIKTGLNEAFYITQEQRDAFVKADPRCADFLVPLLRGRFVGRYSTRWDGTWMLFIPWHFPLHTDQSISGNSTKAEATFKAEYPILYKHLESYKTLLNKRNRAETGIRYEWYALQRWASEYYQEFAKPKIIYPNMTKYLPFYFDEDVGFFTNDKGFIINSVQEPLAYLAAVCNSLFFRCCFKDNFPDLLGNTYELRKIFFEKIPMRKARAGEGEVFASLVGLVQAAKGGGKDAEVWRWWEWLIDACVMELYLGGEVAACGGAVWGEAKKLLVGLGDIGSMGEAKRAEAAKALYGIGSKAGHPLARSLRVLESVGGMLGVVREEGCVEKGGEVEEMDLEDEAE